MEEHEKRAWAITQLQRKYAELGRLPTKADFDEPQRCKIKSVLGPWHRGLEIAGLKPVSEIYLRRRGNSRKTANYKRQIQRRHAQKMKEKQLSEKIIG